MNEQKEVGPGIKGVKGINIGLNVGCFNLIKSKKKVYKA
jgi:hypothetical protein